MFISEKRSVQFCVLLLVATFICWPSWAILLTLDKGVDVTVGVVSTQTSTYDGEYNTALGVMDLFRSVGAKVVLVDYNKIVNEAAATVRGSDVLQSAVESVLHKFLKDNNIERVFIPGNYYNIYSPPLSPVPNRQWVTNAVVSIMKREPKLHLLAICGGLQGVLHAQGVKIRRVQHILHSDDMAMSHVASVPDPRKSQAPLVRVKAVDGGRIAKIAKQVSNTLVFYMPDVHSEAVDKSAENMMLLRTLGYKVIALSEDGIIEALEDADGNILMQMHPEYLLMNVEDKQGKDSRIDASIAVALGIICDFLNGYAD